MAGDELTPQEAENLKNQKITEELIENLAQLYVKQGFSADIEQARSEASEAIKKSKAERLKSHNHTEELIEREAQRYVRERFCTDIEEARREAREAMWPFA
jgi:CRISPR/Cas system-associated protein Cas10 (large subunit of type III CRISPR-Cas system)